MYERFAHGSLSIDFSDVVNQALSDGRDVELARGEESGIVVVVDGVKLPNERYGFPMETFTWPLDEVDIGRGESQELVEEIAREIRRRRTERRNATANTEQHATAEGYDAE